jgi:sortase A
MKPDTSSPGGDAPTPAVTGGSLPSPHPDTQQTAANVIRTQIDALYGAQPGAAAATDEQPSTYHRTHAPHPQPQAEQWQAYHSAWQNYYQKYYENYYQYQSSQPQPQSNSPVSHYFSQQTDAEQTAEELSNDQALYELRQTLLGRVKESARKVRRSRHFVPIAAAIGVVLIFLFIQYNRLFIANVQAYVSPGSIDPQNIVVNPNADLTVSPDPRLIIPKINVDVPVVYDIGNDHTSQMAAMENGVAHFAIPGANSHPGEIGNTAIAGHSSNDLFDGGDYKFIFAQLEKLAPGDSIYANYNGKRYTYVVTKTEVVKPSEIGKLVYPTDKPMLTLITCTPLGTAIDRLLVTAEQVSPDPTTATAAPEGSGQSQDSGDASIPGNSPTLFERLFGN